MVMNKNLLNRQSLLKQMFALDKQTKETKKEYWKIMGIGWAKPILKLKNETSDLYLKRMKTKGYTVEEV